MGESDIKCSAHLAEYILKEDADKKLREALKENSEFYQSLLEQKEREKSEYFQSEKSLWKIINRHIDRLNEEGRIKNTGPFNTYSWADYKYFEMIVILGHDFKLLLETMKENETLSNQWRSIAVLMRMLGYDKFNT